MNNIDNVPRWFEGQMFHVGKFQYITRSNNSILDGDKDNNTSGTDIAMTLTMQEKLEGIEGGQAYLNIDHHIKRYIEACDIVRKLSPRGSKRYGR